MDTHIVWRLRFALKVALLAGGAPCALETLITPTGTATGTRPVLQVCVGSLGCAARAPSFELQGALDRDFTYAHGEVCEAQTLVRVAASWTEGDVCFAAATHEASATTLDSRRSMLPPRRPAWLATLFDQVLHGNFLDKADERLRLCLEQEPALIALEDLFFEIGPLESAAAFACAVEPALERFYREDAEASLRELVTAPSRTTLESLAHKWNADGLRQDDQNDQAPPLDEAAKRVPLVFLTEATFATFCIEAFQLTHILANAVKAQMAAKND